MTIADWIRRQAETLERPPRSFRREFADESDAAQRILWAHAQGLLEECDALLEELRLSE